jgi:uncharacterized protein (DUF2461 family)
MHEPPALPSERDDRASGAYGAGVSADVLSDVLRSVRLTGAVYFDFALSSPWAAAVGYESEAAFSRAFKKLVGEAPAAWRRANVTRASSTSARASSDLAER